VHISETQEKEQFYASALSLFLFLSLSLSCLSLCALYLGLRIDVYEVPREEHYRLRKISGATLPVLRDGMSQPLDHPARLDHPSGDDPPRDGESCAQYPLFSISFCVYKTMQ
jgi:hypothetical protein